MKLKTLKDISWECKWELEGCKHCIKKEAIKWVKEGLKENWNNLIGATLMEFFNITEEDLK